MLNSIAIVVVAACIVLAAIQLIREQSENRARSGVDAAEGAEGPESEAQADDAPIQPVHLQRAA